MSQRLTIVGAISFAIGIGCIGVSFGLGAALPPIAKGKNLPWSKETYLTVCFSYFPSSWCSPHPGGRHSDRLAALQ